MEYYLTFMLHFVKTLIIKKRRNVFIFLFFLAVVADSNLTGAISLGEHKVTDIT